MGYFGRFLVYFGAFLGGIAVVDVVRFCKMCKSCLAKCGAECFMSASVFGVFRGILAKVRGWICGVLRAGCA